jgi:hypothetical protein
VVEESERGMVGHRVVGKERASAQEKDHHSLAVVGIVIVDNLVAEREVRNPAEVAGSLVEEMEGRSPDAVEVGWSSLAVEGIDVEGEDIVAEEEGIAADCSLPADADHRRNSLGSTFCLVSLFQLRRRCGNLMEEVKMWLGGDGERGRKKE